ncbi:hypothetical protein GCM10009821_08450 [Aeromicrobium halocynthiae]|uniref:Uncharacterized protein n=1 Tax=Aeromicrobium halocynthiae TaxID=560557 RepID=A0ABN2VUN2_9ACTN
MGDAEGLQVVLGDREPDHHLVGTDLDVLHAEDTVETRDVAHGASVARDGPGAVPAWLSYP